MKKFLFIAAAALAMVSCSKDSEVIPSVENGKQNAIGFQVTKQNMGRAASDMQTAHYNFGTWAYKVPVVGTVQDVMENYLVGYFNNGAYKQGEETTNGSFVHSGATSLWSYEGLGYNEYSNTDDGWYKKTDTKFMSNIEKQYLKYWDYSSSYTMFYAYAPYINTTATGHTVTFDKSTEGTQILKFPTGSIEEGYNIDTKEKEYLYAAAKVSSASYNNAVQLQFKRLNAKMRIAFYEVINGYKVTINNLTSTHQYISAAPAKAGASNYVYCNELYHKAGAKITFNGGLDDTTGEVAMQYDAPSATVYSDTEYLKFAIPEGGSYIATNPTNIFSDNNSRSATVYYAIPKNNNCGLTFHVSFTLTSEDTNETIYVEDATVHVPNTACVWENNKQYSYIFKITKDVTGTTKPGAPGHVTDPASPEVNKKALYPIVFDNLTVEDWTEAPATEHDIN